MTTIWKLTNKEQKDNNTFFFCHLNVTILCTWGETTVLSISLGENCLRKYSHHTHINIATSFILRAKVHLQTTSSTLTSCTCRNFPCFSHQSHKSAKNIVPDTLLVPCFKMCTLLQCFPFIRTWDDLFRSGSDNFSSRNWLFVSDDEVSRSGLSHCAEGIGMKVH